tara:strand:+ start:1619 stop:2125 length:507 start_codon:yes stop_codon:yes gene_type:complete
MNDETKNENEYIEIKECPICLDILDISNIPILTLDCCNKEIHLNCMRKWILDPQNKNKDKCVLCRTSSDLIIDIGGSILYEPNNNTNNTNNTNVRRQLSENNTVNSDDTSDDTSDNSSNILNSRNNILSLIYYRHTTRRQIIIVNIFCFSSIFFMIFYLVLISYDESL